MGPSYKKRRENNGNAITVYSDYQNTGCLLSFFIFYFFYFTFILFNSFAVKLEKEKKKRNHKIESFTSNQ